MKTIDYSCMSHFELDLKAAEYLYPDANIALNQELRIFLDEEPFDKVEFRPSYDDNMQADKLLFGELFLRNDDFSFNYTMELGNHNIVIEDFHKNIEICEDIEYCKDEATYPINKAKVRAFLKAWDALDRLKNGL